MEFCAEDECVEVTPEVVRVRKVELDATTAGPRQVAGQGPRTTVLTAPADTLNSVPGPSTRHCLRLCALVMRWS